VLTRSESGNAGQKIPDEEVLLFATENNLILLTLNRKHFIKLHNEQPIHAGIIVCTFDPDFVGQANRIHSATTEQSNISGMLLRVNRPLN